MNIHANPTPIRRRIALVAALAAGALVLAPATSQAGTKFGTNVAPDLQPSNAGNGHTCQQYTGSPGKCTWIEYEAYSNGGPLQSTAPERGKLRKIKWIAQAPGSFRLVLAKVKQNGDLGKVTYRSRKITYDGQPQNADPDTYVVEKAKVRARVKKGHYLGIEADSTSMLRCSSGGPNTLLFQPYLRVRNPFAPATDSTGCWLLIQGVIK